ncbi:MAG: hypothetical protein ACYDAZ_09165 [Thermoplasmataceae archaeon]
MNQKKVIKVPITEVKPRLEAWFGQASAMGVRYVFGHPILPNGTELSRSTSCGFFVVSTLREGRVYGYDTKDNPRVREEIIRMVGGHDFALIHGRWIVDPWICAHIGLSSQAVHDLMDPADAESILRFYGDPAVWRMLLPGSGGYIDPPERTNYSEVLRARLASIPEAEVIPAGTLQKEAPRVRKIS